MRGRATALRNGVIIVAVAGLFTFLGDGLDLTAGAVNQLVMIAFVVGLGLLGYSYFRENRLKWLVIKKPLRAVIIACAAAIVALLVLGPVLLDGVLSPSARLALVAALGLVIGWIVMQSRRY